MKLKSKYNIDDKMFVKNYNSPVEASVTSIRISAYKDRQYTEYNVRYVSDSSRCEPEYSSKTVTPEEMYDDKMECAKAILGLTGSYEELKI